MKIKLGMVLVVLFALSCHERERRAAVVTGAIRSADSVKGEACCVKNIPNRFAAVAVALPGRGGAGVSAAAAVSPARGGVEDAAGGRAEVAVRGMPSDREVAAGGMRVGARPADAAGMSAGGDAVAVAAHPGMVWVPGGTFRMGADNTQASADEYPKHAVRVTGFWMDRTEVTNAQFAAFVRATGYVTTAERKPDWNELKKQLPPGTPRPDVSLLVAASLVFAPPDHPVGLSDYTQWWEWKKGASWRHPHGPGSDIKGKENYPVVQVSWRDAVAYCKWAHKRLPTEAEWEFAARGGLTDKIYPWGNDRPGAAGEAGAPRVVHGNFWEGHFPDKNASTDGYYYSAPVGSFAPNGYGLVDMAGNVWEWCADYYREDYYKQLAAAPGGGLTVDPRGPVSSHDPGEPYARKRVMRGGSFLCNESYCTGYRVSRRMKSTEDSGMEHLGFRCVSN
jgi:formylglycine-generating enzyme